MKIRSDRKFHLSDRSGQSTLEYILVLILAISVSVGVSRGMLKSFNLSILKFNAALERDLKTGRTPQETFKNDT